jgi:lipoate-protein ligase A
MRFLNLTLPSLAENLALDEALLLEAEAARDAAASSTLRVWEWSDHAVVLGAGARLAEEVDEAACSVDSVCLARRSSGGGTVLVGPGCLLYSLILPRTGVCDDVNASYRHILGQVAGALADLAPGAAQAGTSDLACGGRKFSGNSQQRKRTHFLHHGTLLFSFDLARVSRYLRLPRRQPDYRQGRAHEHFLTNLATSAAELTRRLCACWQAADPGSWPQETVQKLVAEKYDREEWTRRR